MSWCDKLASTPTLGFRFDPAVAPTADLLRAMSSILLPFHAADTPSYQIEQTDPLSFGFITDEGFKYGVDASRVHVSFNYRLRARAQSGGPPTMELLSKPQPFTSLLPTVAKKVIEASLQLPDIKNRKLRRVGVIALTQVDEGDAPPGLTKFIEYLSRPWGRDVPAFEVNIVSVLHEDATTKDRCIHVVRRPEDPDELLTVQFDWQRDYKDGRASTKQALEAVVDEAQRDALRYLEKVGEGGLFDEQIINANKSAPV